jgi:hypothetical protein
MDLPMTASRRTFLLASLSAGASLALSRAAFAEDGQKLAESDPKAQSLGYVRDAAHVDKTRFPNYVAGQECANCSLYQGSAKDAWSKCMPFGDKLVAQHGWCSAYTNM